MDKSQASAKMLKDRRRQLHTKLVSTFADGQYCWVFPTELAPFEKGYEEYRKQKPPRLGKVGASLTCDAQTTGAIHLLKAKRHARVDSISVLFATATMISTLSERCMPCRSLPLP